MAESAFLVGDRVRLCWSGEVVEVVSTNPCPFGALPVFSYTGNHLCYDSHAVFVTRISLEKMLKECLE
jgi:hypothetical protein